MTATRPALYLVATPTQREDYESAADRDVATVLEAAATFALDNVDLTDTLRWQITTLFPHATAQQIHDHLQAVGGELWDWHHRDNGIEVDGAQVPEDTAAKSRGNAERLARRLLDQAGVRP